jgi:hypothetical protein
MSILKRIDTLSAQQSFVFSEIKLTQFYGVELDDFAHEVAMLSLWLAEHQMNLEFYKAFGRTSPSLPLHDGGQIVHGNATRVNWEEVCPKNEGDEIYILGNPPYLGSSMQNKEQKADKDLIFKGVKNYKNLDYIACWFYIGAKYIQNMNAKFSFVSTNSINQGEQVSMLWTNIFKLNLEIYFAHQSFKWQNNAKSNAAVIVVIIGLRHISNKPKYLYNDNIKHEVKNINAYLVNAENIIVPSRSKRLSNIPLMSYGCKFTDGGNLILSSDEKDVLLQKYPSSLKFIKKLVGSQELIKGFERWCLYIEDNDLNEAQNIPFIQDRLQKVAEMRKKSKALSTVKRASIPHKYESISYNKSTSIVIPRVSSERRKYIPIGYVDENTVVLDSAQAIYDAEPWIFGVISSLIHMVWMRTVAGRLKTDYRYSSALVYNTFPFPNISQKQKDEITELVFGILDEREYHSEKTLAQLYDPDKMPEGLRKAHHILDRAIEQCYRPKPFESDEERLEYLFKMYEEMTSKATQT